MTQSALSAYFDSELLSMRVKDLPIAENSLPYKGAVKRLFSKLKKRGLDWTPEIWASDEWFSPDGRAGFAFPFTLLDERLIKLEKQVIGFCEGSTEREFEKLINHECAHALDNAFGTRKGPIRIKVFGDSDVPYPKSYLPLPYSKNFVRHLPGNYAQAHPEEDWAETFAVWLGTKTKWKARYKNWPALKKLLACDEIMLELKGARPKRIGRGRPLHFKSDERTLKEYFAWKKKELGLTRRNFYSRSAKAIFSNESGEKAVRVINRNQKRLAKSLTKVDGVRAYEANCMIRELKRECLNKNYSLPRKRRDSYKEIERALLASAPKFVKNERRRIYM